MKAVVYTEYGSPDVLKIAEVEKPVPHDGQVLIKVHAASINAMDWRSVKATPFIIRLMGGGLLKPKNTRLGSDVAGTVESVGENVTQFHTGDEVFGCASGSFAEYVLAKEVNLARKPANVSFEQAAAVPVGGLTALQGLRYGGIQPGQKVLIQGASGSVGSLAIQLAKSFGGVVTAVCSTRNQELARSLGAEHVIDYTKEDFTRGAQKYDLIFAANGYHPLSAYRRALNPGGRYVCAGGSINQMFQALVLGSWMSRNSDKKLSSMGIAKVDQQDLVYLGELLESVKITPFIDHSYPLNQTAQAFWYIERQHPQGKVIVSVNAEQQ